MARRGDGEAGGADDDVGESGRAARPVRRRYPLIMRQRRCREDGQTMAEYVVVLAVITPFLILTFGMLADEVIENIQTMIGFLTGG
jgi:Flp pilus assembly pilin Flp